MKHLEAFARDEDFVAVLAVFITNAATANIPSSTADYLASAILVARMKKNEEDTQALRELMGPNFGLPINPLAMACVFVKLTCNCVISGIKDDFAEVTEPC
jgi:hypothetical protein